jgi:hypothetical protein
MQDFNRWLQDYVETCSNDVVITDEISNLAAGPLFTVTRYEGMDINGYTFYTMTQDKKSVYQNSGVRVGAIVDDSHDDDDDTEIDTYYGQIEEIWELDYVGLKVAFFPCRWVTNGKRVVSKEKYGYVSVDLWVFGYKNEPFVFANDVEQVFYVSDLAKKNWYLVMPKKRIVGIKNFVEEEEYNQFDEIPSFDTSYKPQLLGTNKKPYLQSDHSEKIHIQKSRKKRQA